MVLVQHAACNWCKDVPLEDYKVKLLFNLRESQVNSRKKLTPSVVECSNWHLASKYFGLTCMPWVGRGDSEDRKGVDPEDWLLRAGENCSSASILQRTEEGNTADQVPNRWRIEGRKLGFICLYASQKTLIKMTRKC